MALEGFQSAVQVVVAVWWMAVVERMVVEVVRVVRVGGMEVGLAAVETVVVDSETPWVGTAVAVAVAVVLMAAL